MFNLASPQYLSLAYLNFASSQQFYLALAVSVANAFVLCCVSYKLLHIFQLSGYKTRNFLAWSFDRKTKFYSRLFTLSFLSFASMLIVNVLFDGFKDYIYLSYLGLIFYFTLSVVFIANVQRTPAKVSLKLTARIQRLWLVLFAVCFTASLAVIWVGSTQFHSIRFALIALLPMLLPFLVLLCHFITYPIELIVKWHYMGKASRKLKRPEYSGLIRIGITGSWGKTSCKNILKTMLDGAQTTESAQPFSVCASPQSFNTPMGYCKTVNNILEPENNVLIFEMGARFRYDIRILARIFKPHHGLLTSIGAQHIETFRTIENVKLAKQELIIALPAGGIAVVNGNNEKCREVFAECQLEKKYAPSMDCVEKIKITDEGCSFTLHLGKEQIACKTKLLGMHNIENILMCAQMAYALGVTSAHIAAAIEKLKPSPHRLELVKAENGVLILDDSYNASPGGTKAALEVLKLFKGKKIVMTPGLVELGVREAEENFKLGVRIAEVADHVIIVNELNQAAITDGLVSENFPKDKIHAVRDIEQAKTVYAPLLKAGDVLLIENDLPDNYI